MTMQLTKSAAIPLAKYIDHTLLKADATEAMIEKLCAEAREHHFFSVCINPQWVPLAKEELKNSGVKICSVAGFPLGASLTSTKVGETVQLIQCGADEIDMVLSIGALKSGNTEYVFDEIKAVVGAAPGRIIKVILETSLLERNEKIRACELTQAAGAHFVKTSTGFGTAGATVEDIKLMRDVCGPDFGIKASGGIRDRKTAEAMIAAGATRIGTSNSVGIVMDKGNS
jgi:deoxyribose-phosphate aldolase